MVKQIIAFGSNIYFYKLITVTVAKQAGKNTTKQIRQTRKCGILRYVSPNAAKVYRNRHRVRIHHRFEQPANTQLTLMIERFCKLLDRGFDIRS